MEHLGILLVTIARAILAEKSPSGWGDEREDSMEPCRNVVETGLEKAKSKVRAELECPLGVNGIV